MPRLLRDVVSAGGDVTRSQRTHLPRCVHGSADVPSPQPRVPYVRPISMDTGRPRHLLVIASALASVALAGCDHPTERRAESPQSPVKTSHSSTPSKHLGCGTWAKPGSDLAHDVLSQYGEIDGCGTVNNV
jgi:hypothetical protein